MSYLRYYSPGACSMAPRLRELSSAASVPTSSAAGNPARAGQCLSIPGIRGRLSAGHERGTLLRSACAQG